jgi:hypothetical protein
MAFCLFLECSQNSNKHNAQGGTTSPHLWIGLQTLALVNHTPVRMMSPQRIWGNPTTSLSAIPQPMATSGII